MINIYIKNVSNSVYEKGDAIFCDKSTDFFAQFCCSLQLYGAFWHLSAHCFGFCPQIVLILINIISSRQLFSVKTALSTHCTLPAEWKAEEVLAGEHSVAYFSW